MTHVSFDEPIEGAAVLPAAGDESRERLLREVAPKPENVPRRIAIAREGGLWIVERREHRDIHSSPLARELAGCARVHDATRIDQIVRDGRLFVAVDEERPLLGIQHRESRVSGDL